ncbi:hypothetical protein [Cysteiniphilum sp. QT6929]|uniref:hypothetical protein n=1 Tax=Cysteiniphilum sp. QT6929 TaxID=2975055 RepID=UPI0024B386C2|nr:hypothetical protein [Cysteiniphilum sp. QT6929]WHN65291.1 hypothetical protein NYP54_09615 [Cysteiniphilum sp. QT6929]
MKKTLKLSLCSSMMAIMLSGQVNAAPNSEASLTATVSASIPITFTSNVAFVLYDGLGHGPQKNPASLSLTLGANASMSVADDTVAESNMKGVFTGLKIPVTDANEISTEYFDTEALKWFAIYEEQSTKNISEILIRFKGLIDNEKTINGKKLKAEIMYPLDDSGYYIEDKAGVTLGVDNVPARVIDEAKQTKPWNLGSYIGRMEITSPIASDKVVYFPLAFLVGSEDVYTETEYMNTFGDAGTPHAFNPITIEIQATFS